MAPRVKSIDHYVEHVSTVSAIEGQIMRQLVREKVSFDGANKLKDPAKGKVVLVMHGGFWPCSVAFDCPYPGYSWMEALAEEGFDVFALDMTGHGRSALALQDYPQNVQFSDRHFMPAKYESVGKPDWPFQLVTTETETADLDAVMDYISELRHVKKSILSVGLAEVSGLHLCPVFPTENRKISYLGLQ